MKVPAYIRSIPRPDHTVVYIYGPQNDKYGVRCTDPSSQNYKKVIGHIIGSQYISCSLSNHEDLKNKPITYKNWGEFYLANALMNDIRFDLLDYFSDSDANRIFLIALIRACCPDVTDHLLKTEYDDSFLSEWFPEVPLSKDSVSDFFHTLGTHKSSLLEYMRHRMENISASDEIIIDGTLKTNDSTVNTMSAFSRKGRIKNRNDISLLYAYSFENQEPICSECFPGNMVDAVSGVKFIEKHNIKKGLLVTDKGFPPGTLQKYLSDKPDLHYLIPIKRSSVVIDQLGLLNFTGGLPSFPGVLYKKTITMEYYEGDDVFVREIISPEGRVIGSQIVKESLLFRKYDEYLVNKEDGCTEGLFKDWVTSRKIIYYGYLDPYISFRETHGWVMRELRSDVTSPDEYYEKYKNMRDDSGTIVFQSDIDVSADEAYEIFDSRWSIEICMKYYKTFVDLDDVREHSDFNVIGSEFVNFFACLLAVRMEHYIQHCGIEGKSGKDILRILKRVKMIYKDGAWAMSDITDGDRDILIELGVLPRPIPKKRGRKPKPKSKNQENLPKRKRGRPRKEVSHEEEAKPKRKPGRPKKEVNSTLVNQPKRKPGRPRKVISPEEVAKPKRKPGRPRKDTTVNMDCMA